MTSPHTRPLDSLSALAVDILNTADPAAKIEKTAHAAALLRASDMAVGQVTPPSRISN